MAKMKRKNIEEAEGKYGNLTFNHRSQKHACTLVNSILYDQMSFREENFIDIPQDFKLPEVDEILWLNFDGIPDDSMVNFLQKNFNIESQHILEICEADQRPVFEDHVQYIQIILKMIYLNAEKNQIITEQIVLFLGTNWVISIQEGPLGDVFNNLRDRLKKPVSKIRKQGPDYLISTMIDAIIDHYFVVTDVLSEKIEELEEVLMNQTEPTLIKNIYHLKRDIFYLRKIIFPIIDILRNIKHSESYLIEDRSEVYFQDSFDQVNEIVDQINTFHNMLANLHDIYTAGVSNRMGEVIKVLTMISTIFIPLTFLAGLYGMNFKNMPELSMSWTYPALLIFMLLIAGSMLIFFKRKKWL